MDAEERERLLDVYLNYHPLPCEDEGDEVWVFTYEEKIRMRRWVLEALETEESFSIG